MFLTFIPSVTASAMLMCLLRAGTDHENVHLPHSLSEHIDRGKGCLQNVCKSRRTQKAHYCRTSLCIYFSVARNGDTIIVTVYSYFHHDMSFRFLLIATAPKIQKNTRDGSKHEIKEVHEYVRRYSSFPEILLTVRQSPAHAERCQVVSRKCMRCCIKLPPLLPHTGQSKTKHAHSSTETSKETVLRTSRLRAPSQNAELGAT